MEKSPKNCKTAVAANKHKADFIIHKTFKGKYAVIKRWMYARISKFVTIIIHCMRTTRLQVMTEALIAV